LIFPDFALWLRLRADGRNAGGQVLSYTEVRCHSITSSARVSSDAGGHVAAALGTLRKIAAELSDGVLTIELPKGRRPSCAR
jgi:hypothetical protein